MDLTSWVDFPVVGKFLKRGPKIPVIRLSGIIMDSTMRKNGLCYSRAAKMIEKAFSVQKAAAVAVVINSPGGAPAQSQLIGGLIRQMADEKELTVYAFVEDVAASGGYWLACAADYIYVQETSVVGSIGVISAGFGLEDFIGKHGIKRRLYTAGQDKSMLDPFQPEKPGDVARLRQVQKELHEHFIRWVKNRRGGRLMGDDNELFEGRFWTGADALEYGIADDVGDVRSVMREKYGEDIRLIDFNPDKRKLLPSIPGLLRSDVSEDWIGDVLSAIEDHGHWGRFGL